MFKAIPKSKYTERKAFPLADGAAAQWLHTGTTTAGTQIAMRSMAHIYITEDGKIRRVEQYLDGAQAAPTIAALQAAGAP